MSGSDGDGGMAWVLCFAGAVGARVYEYDGEVGRVAAGR